MSLRHAAALALVGWYLLSPPIVLEGEKAKIDGSVPLSQWHRGDRVYETESACEEENAKLRAIAESHKNWIGPSGSVAAANDRYVLLTNQRCIATDDPRLKEK
jgi:hypothetical protein